MYALGSTLAVIEHAVGFSKMNIREETESVTIERRVFCWMKQGLMSLAGLAITCPGLLSALALRSVPRVRVSVHVG